MEPSKKAKQATEKFARQKDDLSKYDEGTGLEVDGVKTVPANYFSKSKLEEDLFIRNAYLRGLNDRKIKPVVNVDVTKDELDLVKKKLDEEEMIAFERYLLSKYDIRKPADRDLLHRRYPLIFERQTDRISQVLKIQEKLAQIRVHGALTPEDEYLEFCVVTDRVQIPTEAPWKEGPVNMDAAAFKYARYNVFSKQKVPTKMQTGTEGWLQNGLVKDVQLGGTYGTDKKNLFPGFTSRFASSQNQKRG